MNKRSPPLDTYYREAESWAADRQQALLKSRSVAWKAAAVAAAIALLEGVALIVSMPLKKDVPYVMLVDRHTGYVQAIDPADQGRITADSALTDSFLAQYVVARESYDADSLQNNYRKVGLWSAESARSDYIAGMQPSSPQSPLVRYPRSAVVETHVKSISSLGPNLAMVRFETRVAGEGGAGTAADSWVATIRYRYSGEPMAIADRLVNPLGFQVTRYRRSAEAPPAPAPVVLQPAPAAVAVQPPPQATAR